MKQISYKNKKCNFEYDKHQTQAVIDMEADQEYESNVHPHFVAALRPVHGQTKVAPETVQAGVLGAEVGIALAPVNVYVTPNEQVLRPFIATMAVMDPVR